MTPAGAPIARAAEHRISTLLTTLRTASGSPPEGQDLAAGSIGIALAHIERARSGAAGWPAAHALILEAVSSPLSEHDSAALFRGVPAVAFALDTAAGDSRRYRSGLADLDPPVARLAERRARDGLARIAAGQPAAFAEYDVLRGLAGIGALLARRDPGGNALELVLSYLVALTRPLQISGEQLPGWWVSHDPHRTIPPGYAGHANLGAAHGISGPLALLATTARRGITVDGQHQAITDICDWLDDHRRDSDSGHWWPEHLGAEELTASTSRHGVPGRPGWCYGTPGIARAGQLAAIALGDTGRQHGYESALLACVGDEDQLGRLTDAGLCHGWAGTFQTVWRAAADAATAELRQQIPYLADALLNAADRAEQAGPGFLNGTAGTALALHTAATDAAPASGWDACLLID